METRASNPEIDAKTDHMPADGAPLETRDTAAWQHENQAAIAEYNAYVAKHGLTLSEFRRF